MKKTMATLKKYWSGQVKATIPGGLIRKPESIALSKQLSSSTLPSGVVRNNRGNHVENKTVQPNPPKPKIKIKSTPSQIEKSHPSILIHKPQIKLLLPTQNNKIKKERKPKISRSDFVTPIAYKEQKNRVKKESIRTVHADSSVNSSNNGDMKNNNPNPRIKLKV